MSSSLSQYSDSDTEHRRDRSASFPPRGAAGRRTFEKRHQPYSKGPSVRCHTSLIALEHESGASLQLTPSSKSSRIAVGNRVSSKKHQLKVVAAELVNGGTTRRISKKGLDAPASFHESGSTTSLSGGSVSGGGGTSEPLWTRSRRQHHRRKGLEEDVANAHRGRRQQNHRIVSAGIGLVVMLLASGQIIVSLVVHSPPREGAVITTASSFQVISSDNNMASGETAGGGTGVFRRRTADGVQISPFLRNGEMKSNRKNPSVVDKDARVTIPSTGGNAMRRGSPADQHHQGSSSRAFEMVAADMGHLKDTVRAKEPYYWLDSTLLISVYARTAV